MSWTLETPAGQVLDVNAWNWRPTLVLLEQAGVLDAETIGLLSYTIDTELSAEQARRIAGFLDHYLRGLPPDGRVRLDGTVTTEPDTFEFHRDDLAKNYSATTEWLVVFRDFCRAAADGFTVG